MEVPDCIVWIVLIYIIFLVIAQCGGAEYEGANDAGKVTHGHIEKAEKAHGKAANEANEYVAKLKKATKPEKVAELKKKLAAARQAQLKNAVAKQEAAAKLKVQADADVAAATVALAEANAAQPSAATPAAEASPVAAVAAGFRNMRESMGQADVIAQRIKAKVDELKAKY